MPTAELTQALGQDFDLRIWDDLLNLSPDRQDFEELIGVFVKNSLDRMSSLKEASKKRDFETYRALAHAMKGSCAAFGVRKLSQWSQSLEDRCENLADDMRDQELEEFSRKLVEAHQILSDFKGLE